jgi:hypothetical protein
VRLPIYGQVRLRPYGPSVREGASEVEHAVHLIRFPAV